MAPRRPSAPALRPDTRDHLLHWPDFIPEGRPSYGDRSRSTTSSEDGLFMENIRSTTCAAHHRGDPNSGRAPNIIFNAAQLAAPVRFVARRRERLCRLECQDHVVTTII